MTTILLTGFEPFNKAATNPSWQAVRLIAEGWDRPETLVIAELPVAYGATGVRMRALLAEHQPDLIVAVGLANGRDKVTPERVAINIDDARIPDNIGQQPIDELIASDGPAAYFSSLPIKAAVAALQEREIPAAVSNSAGTFLCNNVFYVLMHELATSDLSARGGFVHVPLATEDAEPDQPSLPIDTIAEAVRIIVETSLAHVKDVALVGGAEH